MQKLPKVAIDVVDVKQVVVTPDPAGETVVTIEVVGGQMVELHLAPHASAKLEAFLSRASLEQAKLAPIQ
ncbi:hypothetical protein LJR090_001799 [Bosea sp. LjRoot90]|uniref:hypothetical protein n=1 Tax=Bosea sp. LjRoot90 TaxID=3342342 RepID=UPI003ED0D529